MFHVVAGERVQLCRDQLFLEMSQNCQTIEIWVTSICLVVQHTREIHGKTCATCSGIQAQHEREYARATHIRQRMRDTWVGYRMCDMRKKNASLDEYLRHLN